MAKKIKQRLIIDPNDKDFGVNFFISNKLWLAKKGKVVKIEKMTIEHLINTIKLVKTVDNWRSAYLPVLQAELDKRINC